MNASRHSSCPGRVGGSLLLGCTLVLLAVARPALAQSVRGVVRERGGHAVAGALVALLDRADSAQAQGLTDPDGGYLLTAPRAGVYRVRVERIGYRAATSPPLTLSAGDTLTYNAVASVEAVSLRGIDVKGKRRCVVRPSEGQEVATVWQEARKALETARRTRAQGLVRYDLRTYQRRLDTDGQHVLHEKSHVVQGTGERPFRSLPAARLMARGFLAVTDTGRIYYAPDPDVLLSDAFLDTHCFRLARNPQDTTVIGLEFDPVRKRQVTDISGTFWLSRRTDNLKTLRFHYLDDLDRSMESSALGGYEAFQALPSGAWIIRRWWIRGPLVTVHRLPMGGKRQQLSGIYETGGEVADLRVSGRRVLHSRMAVLTGIVRDSLAGRPLAGARVQLRGTDHATQTNATGQFALAGVAPGTYDVVFRHPKLDSLGLALPPRSVDLTAGDTTHVVLAVPSLQTLLGKACPAGARTGRRGLLVGVVADSLSGTRLPDARVRVSWPAPSRPGMVASRSVTTDGGGRYRVCGAPAGVPLTLRVRALGHTELGTVTVPPGGAARLDFALRLPTSPATAMPLRPLTVTGLSRRTRADLARGTHIARITQARLDTLSDGATDIRSVLQRAHMLGLVVHTVEGKGGPYLVCIEPQNAPTPHPGVGCRQVLVIVDGNPMADPESGILNIDPQDLKDVEYLSPVEAATVYGTEAKNGVLVITTKDGKSGR